jgi:ornithine cyclodeaminase/alanine dehydrogenase-like protein (mu-crystallin family)
LTLLLSEKDVDSLLRMDEVVQVVEESFRRQSKGEAFNSPRTRSLGKGAVLNAMHASLSYLGRSGLKCYVSSHEGTRFLFILFDDSDAKPLAVMGASNLGRFRTGAASGVATKHLYGKKSGILAVCGSGYQASTQARAIASVMTVPEVRVWSPNREHRQKFAKELRRQGLEASASDSAEAAFDGADVASSITSSDEPFIEREFLEGVSHVNICGSNSPGRLEISTDAIRSFETIVVDDLPQAKIEYGDLIQAAEAGALAWDRVVELKEVVGGHVKPRGKTLFKSGGVALEDVAVASMVYDKAVESGRFTDSVFELG